MPAVDSVRGLLLDLDGVFYIGSELVPDAVQSCFSVFPANHHNPDFVVIGDIGSRWNYEILNDVFNMLMRGAKLLCLHQWHSGADGQVPC